MSDKKDEEITDAETIAEILDQFEYSIDAIQQQIQKLKQGSAEREAYSVIYLKKARDLALDAEMMEKEAAQLTEIVQQLQTKQGGIARGENE